MFASSTADDDEDDDEEDEEDFDDFRRSVRGRGSSMVGAAPARTARRLEAPDDEEEEDQEEDEEDTEAAVRPSLGPGSPPAPVPVPSGGAREDEEEEEEDEDGAEEENYTAAEAERAQAAAETAAEADASAAEAAAAAASNSARFVARSPAPQPNRARVNVRLHNSVAAPRDERERQVRASRVAMLLASRGEPVPSSMLRAATASSKPLTASAPPVEASSASAAITGDLHDAVVAKQEPLLKALANIHDAAPGELWLVRMPVAPSDLPLLVQELATLLEALPIAVSSHGLIGLTFVATPSAPPVILALSRGSPKTMLAAVPQLAARCEVVALASGDADELAPFYQLPSSHSTLVPMLVPSPDADLDLAEELQAPKLARTVLIIKEHALGRASTILSMLSAAGLHAKGARLVHLEAQVGSAAQLGLDTPLLPGAVLAVLLEGYDVCERLLALCGATDSKLARTLEPTSIRARFGVDRTQNAVSTPRHDKGALRCVSYFFGDRLVDTTTRSELVALAFRLVREPILVVCVGASEQHRAAASVLMSCMQRAGFALHGAARASENVLDAIGMGGQATQVPRFAFLLSREGAAETFANAALLEAQREVGDGIQAKVNRCSATVARELLLGTVSTSRDAYKYVLFALKNDIL